MPVPTGSPAVANTIGIADVACFAARGPGVLWVTMTSTLRRTSSLASSLKRSVRPSAQRYSIVRLRPSTQPSSRIRCTKAAVHWLCAAALPVPSNPMVAAFACARAAKGPAAAAPPSSVMNLRRLIIDHLGGDRQQRRRHGDAQHSGGLMVDHQLELARLHNRQICWVRSPKDAAGVGACLTKSIGGVGSIAHQST